MRPKQKSRKSSSFSEWKNHLNGFHNRIGTNSEPIDGSNDTGYDPPDLPIDEREWTDDPFRDDGAVDLSLKDARSPDVNDHSGLFWMQNTDKQQIPETQMPPQQEENQASVKKKKLSAARYLIRAAVAVAVLVFSFFIVFQVTDVDVKGNSQISRDEIRKLAGISSGENIFFLDEDKIETSINSNPYLIYVCLEKTLPGRVTIQVKERTPAAYISYCGILYVMDSRGMVLSSSDDTENPPDLLKLEGLSIRNCGVGRKIALLDENQLSIFMEITREIKALKLTSVVTEIYVTDTSNLYLTTSDGFSVRMGSSERIHAKLRALQLTRNALIAMKKGSGTIDVSTPEYPTYIPESTEDTSEENSTDTAAN